MIQRIDLGGDDLGRITEGNVTSGNSLLTVRLNILTLVIGLCFVVCLKPDSVAACVRRRGLAVPTGPT
jgi:hypothetical protein